MEGIYTGAHCITLLFILSWLCERKAEQQTKASGINTSRRAIQGVNIKAGELCTSYHLPEAVGFSVEVTELLPAWNSSTGNNVVLVAD